MFTPIQFNSLATATWSSLFAAGASAICSTSTHLSSYDLAEGGPGAAVEFSVSLFVGGIEARNMFSGKGSSPFSAIQQATAAYLSSPLGAEASPRLAHFVAVTLRRAELAYAGSCPTCKEEADAFDQCACDYVPASQLVAHA